MGNQCAVRELLLGFQIKGEKLPLWAGFTTADLSGDRKEPRRKSLDKNNSPLLNRCNHPILRCPLRI